MLHHTYSSKQCTTSVDERPLGRVDGGLESASEAHVRLAKVFDIREERRYVTNLDSFDGVVADLEQIELCI